MPGKTPDYMHQLQLVGGPIVTDNRIVLSDQLQYLWFRSWPTRSRP